MEIKFDSIGTILTPFTDKVGMPIQSKGALGIQGKIVLDEKYVAGLTDLDGFSHIILIYYLHQSEGFDLLTTPFLDTIEHGIFATRSPKRPNAIGISVVRLMNIEKNVLHIENVDILNGTPLLDIKPYVPKFDVHETKKNGWFDKNKEDLNQVRSDNRFQ